MDIFQLKQKKKEAKMTNRDIAELSGIPVSTVNKIFSGATRNPRYTTLLAIEEAIVTGRKLPFEYDRLTEEPRTIHESAAAYGYQARPYVGQDVKLTSEHTRVELINGRLYMMAPPARIHQQLSYQISFEIGLHIRKCGGTCEVYPAPFGVWLFGDSETYVEPDISVICRKDILTDKGCNGAPDWIVEVASESNAPHDYVTKLMQYQKAGVREYWIVDPVRQKVFVYNFEEPAKTGEYRFIDAVPSGVMEKLSICISDFHFFEN